MNKKLLSLLLMVWSAATFVSCNENPSNTPSNEPSNVIESSSNEKENSTNEESSTPSEDTSSETTNPSENVVDEYNQLPNWTETSHDISTGQDLLDAEFGRPYMTGAEYEIYFSLGSSLPNDPEKQVVESSNEKVFTIEKVAGGYKLTAKHAGKAYLRITDSNGEIIFKINLMQGKYPITVTNPVSKEKRTTYVTVLPSIIENKDVIMFYRNGSKYIVRLVGLDGKIVGKGAKVTFNINGVFYNRTTDENGYARLNINLNPKSYVITAEYNGCKVSNTIVVKPILTASDLIKKYGDSEPFKVKLVDGKGKELAGETVTFNINGVMYNRITDNSGIAKLNINLMPGKYIITSSYSNGATISNTITINKWRYFYLQSYFFLG